MTPDEARAKIGMEICSWDAASFKYGEWAEIIGLTWVDRGTTRLCYQLIWPDGSTDLWPINDAAADYQFRGAPPVVEVPEPQRDVSDGRGADVPGHAWQLEFGTTRMGMPNYKKIRALCNCGWKTSWMTDADDAVAAWWTRHTG